MKSCKNEYFGKLCEEYGVLVKPGTGKVFCRGQEVDGRHAVSLAFTDMMDKIISGDPNIKCSDIRLKGFDEMPYYFEPGFDLIA